MGKRKRSVPIYFWVSEEEKEMIEQKMAEHGVSNMGAFLRKMAIDGYSIRLELPELEAAVSFLRRASNNLNQIARHANQGGMIYETDIREVRDLLERCWDDIHHIFMALSKYA